MSIPKHAGPVLAAVLISMVLYGSVVAMTPAAYDVTYGPEQGPTPWSADHARAQAKAPNEEAAPTF